MIVNTVDSKNGEGNITCQIVVKSKQLVSHVITVIKSCRTVNNKYLHSD